MDAVALFLDDYVDAHGLFQLDTVVVDEALRLETPIRPLGKGLAQLRFRQIEQAVEAGEDFLLAVLRRQLDQPAFAEPVGAELSADVAEHKLRRAAVGADDALDVAEGLAGALVAHRR